MTRLVHNPSKLDTLQSQIRLLTHQLDSLNKITAKNTVSSEYFHDILTSQVTVFVGILTVIAALIALVSWQLITNRFQRMTEQVRLELLEQIQLHETSVSLLSSEFRTVSAYNNDVLKKQNNEIKRTVYTVLISSKMWDYALYWGLQSILSYQEIKRNDRAINFINNMIMNYSDKSLNTSYYTGKNQAVLHNCFIAIRKNGDQAMQTSVDNLKDIIFKKIYAEGLEK
ncbi:hypothetical protein [Mucilaginibacter sp.]|uniref:hypothetical protein n=1 Tax=Mucilaginibacter sp. TaxID=1882438 RepID=UPI002625A0E0|nr:hypothetical protein [Mucilaginibacter sp.]MDB4919498.1 hypothetical protein [Mucilaginibacter sp.]